MTRNKKGFGHILILLAGIVVVAVVVASLSSPASLMKISETEYVNDEYGFRLTISPNWEAREDTTGYVDGKVVVKNLQIAPVDFKQGFFGNIEIRAGGLDSAIKQKLRSVQDYNKYLVDTGSSDMVSKLASNSKGEINGHEATVLVFETDGRINEYYFAERDYTYVLYKPQVTNSNYETANQILSTFKFIK